MKINLSPVRWDIELVVKKKGDKLTINGEVFDFSVIPDGAILSGDAVASDFVVGDVKRVNGELELTLVLPHGADASNAARFPVPIVNPRDGKVELPV